MASIDLGKIKMVWKGAYSSGTQYEADDIVSYLGSSYIYKFATAASGVVPTTTTHWDKMVNGDGTTALTSTGQLLTSVGSTPTALNPGPADSLLRSNGPGAALTYISPSQVTKASEAVARLPDRRSYGEYFTGCVTSEGEIYMVGCNDRGRLGVGHYGGAGGPGFNLAMLPDGKLAKKLFTFVDRTFAIATDGSLYATGSNNTGALGLGLTSSGGASGVSVTADIYNRRYFTRVVFPKTNYPGPGQSEEIEIVDVVTSDNALSASAGGNGAGTGGGVANDSHTFAVDKYGFLWAWGANTSGELGLGDTTTRYAPVRVPGFLNNSVPANGTGASQIGQPAGILPGYNLRVEKVEAKDSRSGVLVMVDPDSMPSYAATSNLNLYWFGGNASSIFGSGTAATTTATPIQKTAFGLASSSPVYVVDIIQTRYSLSTTASIVPGVAPALGSVTYPNGQLTSYVLLSNGQLFAAGHNAVGQCATGDLTTPVVTWTAINPGGGATFALPPAYASIGASADTVIASIEALGSTIVSRCGSTFAKLNNSIWKCWGFNGNGVLGIGDYAHKTSLQNFTLYHTERIRPSQTIPSTTGGTDYGNNPSEELQGQSLDGVLSHWVVDKICLGGQGYFMNCYIGLKKPSAPNDPDSFRLYSTGYNAQGQLGTGAWTNRVSTTIATYNAFNSEWGYTKNFRKVLLSGRFTANRVADYQVNGHHETAPRILLTNNEMYACGYNGTNTSFTEAADVNGDLATGVTATTIANTKLAFVGARNNGAQTTSDVACPVMTRCALGQ